MSYRFPLHIPVAPMLGDPIDGEGSTVAVSGEFSRLKAAAERFAVEGSDGLVFEVEVVERGDGCCGSQQWRALRRLAKTDFQRLARNDARYSRIRNIRCRATLLQAEWRETFVAVEGCDVHAVLSSGINVAQRPS